MILAHGGQEVGYIFYIQNGELAYEYNSYGRLIKFPRVKLQPGELNIELDFNATGKLLQLLPIVMWKLPIKY